MGHGDGVVETAEQVASHVAEGGRVPYVGVADPVHHSTSHRAGVVDQGGSLVHDRAEVVDGDDGHLHDLIPARPQARRLEVHHCEHCATASRRIVRLNLGRWAHSLTIAITVTAMVSAT